MAKRFNISPVKLIHFALPWILAFTIQFACFATSKPEEFQTYIIHMDHSMKPASFLTHEAWHRSALKSLSSNGSDLLLYSYNHVMHGFSARLTPSQLSEIEKNPAHRATYKESFGKLFTTHTSKFLGLSYSSGIWPAASFGEGVILGILDTGIWPESKSFIDTGMPPPPSRWKGKCESGAAFNTSNCNKKLIGARSFSKGLIAAGRKISKRDFDSARDFYGHGTHTSSTAAGASVIAVSHFGYASGTATGIAPAAHLAMYKVLWATDTYESASSDVLAGMDQAIADGVDIMSLSLGIDRTQYFNDVIAIASLSAIEQGILVVCSAGNDGAYNSTYNGAPWIVTVGAGSIDRSFVASITLGNGVTVEGTSYFPESIYIENATIYYGGEDVKKAGCRRASLNATEVVGKVVICDDGHGFSDAYEQFNEVQKVGAFAGIIISDDPDVDPEDYSFPMVVVGASIGSLIKNYVVKSTNASISMRFVLTKFGVNPAPQVADFSSRGPDPINPSILKPDLIAPGVDILAAVAPNRPFMGIGPYNLVTDYALYSGTSMSAPHVAGVAALLKAIHKDWSPSVIKSALMTTAYIVDNTGKALSNQFRHSPASPLDFGAGHIDPGKAVDPGLVYDLEFQDYIDFLCSLGYTDSQMSAILRRSQWTCSRKQSDLNYPSFTAIFHNGTSSGKVKTFNRVVTNMGNDFAIYRAVLESSQGMKIKVEPNTLSFTRKYEKKNFSLSVEIGDNALGVTYGYLKWFDQHNHIVSSPIVAFPY